MGKAKTETRLEPVKEVFINWLLSPRSDREKDEITFKDFAEKYDVSKATLYNWQNEANFQDKLLKAYKENKPLRLFKVKLVLYNLAIEDNVPAIRLYLQSEGELTMADVKAEAEATLEAKAETEAAKVDSNEDIFFSLMREILDDGYADKRTEKEKKEALETVKAEAKAKLKAKGYSL